jgi:hypothetical protein
VTAYLYTLDTLEEKAIFAPGSSQPCNDLTVNAKHESLKASKEGEYLLFCFIPGLTRDHS